ncbi:MAG: DUF805 domain-containing protein [Ruminococcus sp.]|nr:DUF805 domain-containing protein [Ruminococcus sp.]
MKCKYCGAEVADTVKYCTNCGADMGVFDMPSLEDIVPQQNIGNAPDPVSQQPDDMPSLGEPSVSGPKPYGSDTASGTGARPEPKPAAFRPTETTYGGVSYGAPISHVPADRDDSPVYTDFVGAIKLFFKNYVNFKGRSTRSEYWYAYLFIVIINSICNGFDKALDTSMFGLLWGLASFIPSMAIAFRRLHDIGKSGKIYVISYVVAVIWAIITVVSVGAALIDSLSGSPAPSSFGASFGIMLFFGLIPLGLAIYIIVLFCQPSQSTENQYGRAPY